jgi:hypothetical protein
MTSKTPSQQLKHSMSVLICPYSEKPSISGMDVAPTILVQRLMQGKLIASCFPLLVKTVAVREFRRLIRWLTPTDFLQMKEVSLKSDTYYVGFPM